MILRPTTALVGTGSLVRLALRRDRIRLLLWLVVLAGLPGISAASLNTLFPTAETRAAYAAGVQANSALLSIQGPEYGSSLGAITAGRVLTITALFVALLAVLTVIRHTRAEEEAGRRELLGATVVGRHAGLAAALVVVAGFQVLLAAGTAAGLMAAGLPVGGSVATGLALGGAGLTFAGIAAIAAQVTESARAATGLGIAVLGAAFLLRAAGDASPGSAGWLSWLSPLGWVARVRPYTEERWWVLGLSLALAVVFAGLGAALASRRDIGAGVFPPRLGPASASARLRGPVGLAWRLHRGTLLAWTAGFAVVGASIGAIADGIGQLLDASPQITDLVRALGGGGALVDTFLSAELGMLGLFASGYAVAAALRLSSEEAGQRAEPVLATATSRMRWLLSHLIFALLGPAVALLAAGLGAGLVHGARTGDITGQLPRVLAGALVQVPAVWVLTGITIAVFGLIPRLTALAWGALVLFVLLGEFGSLLGLDHRVLEVSPFSHLPHLPGGAVSAAPLLWLLATAAVLIVAGALRFRRRDLE